VNGRGGGKGDGTVDIAWGGGGGGVRGDSLNAAHPWRSLLVGRGIWYNLLQAAATDL
jgi:hypothetical protein